MVTWGGRHGFGRGGNSLAVQTKLQAHLALGRFGSLESLLLVLSMAVSFMGIPRLIIPKHHFT